ncbi:MAG: hypothetical protein J3K34DRAFT_296646 [Monoraphidium minutum]|nr:MAG: hypothetical protein J3K34DRAFT_296646 [Monoraphidium minutum]
MLGRKAHLWTPHAAAAAPWPVRHLISSRGLPHKHRRRCLAPGLLTEVQQSDVSPSSSEPRATPVGSGRGSDLDPIWTSQGSEVSVGEGRTWLRQLCRQPAVGPRGVCAHVWALRQSGW